MSSGSSPASYNRRRSTDLNTSPSRAAARPEHRTLGHVSTPGPGACFPVQEGRIGAEEEGGQTRDCLLRHLGASTAGNACLISTGDRRHARCAAWGGVGGEGASEGRAACLAPVAAPVGGCECRESCCSCTPVQAYTPYLHPIPTTPYRRRQLLPELENRLSSHATDLPWLAGECGRGK